MSQAGEGSRKPESAKGAGLGREAVVAAARRSPRHSSLFWCLFDQYDELIEAKGHSGLGIPWKSMCRCSRLELSLVGGAPVTAERARQTWLRVQKKKARLAALEAKAEAERAFQRARDPRQNMPSRFTGSFPAPLSDRQPPRVDARPLPPPPAVAAEVGSELTVMPGGPVLTGGPEELLPASEFTIIFEGEPLDLRLFIGPGGPSALGPAGVQRGAANPGDEEASEDALQARGEESAAAVGAIVSTGNGERDLENHENGGRKPVLMVVVGRQRVGKTSFLNALAQYLQERGAEFAIWDTDQMNTTNNMSVFHAQASSPSSERREDVKAWLEERFLDIAERRYDALLDVGGGDTPLTQLVEDVPVAAALAELGVRVVVVQCWARTSLIWIISIGSSATSSRPKRS